jgi:hypothetical protein
MAPVLEDLPSELFERIVQHLDLPSICNLRLGCRLLASKATQRHFKSIFRQKHVDLDERPLINFVHVTQPGGLGCLVEDLVLVGLVNTRSRFLEDYASTSDSGKHLDENKRDEIRRGADIREALRSLRDSKQDVRLLSEALRNLNSSSSTSRGLRSLSLDVRVYLHDSDRQDLPGVDIHDAKFGYSPKYGADFRLIREATAHTFHLAMESLASSRLRVQKLDLYNGIDTQRCSLPLIELDRVGSVEALYPGLRACFASTTSLSLSLCYPSGPQSAYHESVRQASLLRGAAYFLFPDPYRASDHRDHVALAPFLHMLQGLKHLDLHFFGGVRNPRQQDLLFTSSLLRISGDSTLPKLESCRIRGLCLDLDGLWPFLEQTKPSRLALEHCAAISGMWQPIFDYITSPQAGLESLHLDDLFEKFEHLWFDEPGRCAYVHHNMTGCSTVERQGGAVRLPISYFFLDRTRMVDPAIEYDQWLERHRLEYLE